MIDLRFEIYSAREELKRLVDSPEPYETADADLHAWRIVELTARLTLLLATAYGAEAP